MELLGVVAEGAVRAVLQLLLELADARLGDGERPPEVGDGAVLEFKFTDKRRRTRQFQGGPEQFQNFVMHADKCTFRFRAKMQS